MAFSECLDISQVVILHPDVGDMMRIQMLKKINWNDEIVSYIIEWLHKSSNSKF